MKATKKVQNNNVQKQENVKVTALAIIPKAVVVENPQEVATATEVSETVATTTTVQEPPQQPVLKTPLAASTEETDLDIATVFPNSYNPRKTFEKASLQELADSIREVGILHAIAVRPRKEGTGYEIIYGERRYRASLLIGAKTIKSTVYNNVSDEEAEDMSITENLQRREVRPTEEAAAFKQLLEKGRYDMYSLVARFGRSEKYIYTRLKLNELYRPIAELLDKEILTISVAEEISTYEAELQKDVYENHLKEDNRDSWRNYGLRLFRKYFEDRYTTDLAQYNFDKTDCKVCQHNAANYTLFAEHNECGNCTNRICLEAKNTAYVAKATENLLKSDPRLVLAKTCYSNNNEKALEKLDKKGHEAKELSYNVSTQNFPEAPTAPQEQQFEDPTEYKQAVETFEKRQQTYTERVEELNRKKEENRIQTYVKVGQTGPTLCYVEVNKRENTPVTVEILQERDKRNKELSVEKTVNDTKTIVRENDYPDSPFTQYEDSMLYFVMLTKLQRKHLKMFGIKDQPYPLDEKQRVKAVSKLTEEQKTVIKRDFIQSYLCENSNGDSCTSKLLRDFANLHFPDQYGLTKATYDEEYQNRHKRLEERINELKKTEKAQVKPENEKKPQEAEPEEKAESVTTKAEKPKNEQAA